jgi:hypothetical protein
MSLGLERYYEPGERSILAEGSKNALLLTAYGFGSQVGHAFKGSSTNSADNRALELAFLDGFLSTRLRDGNRWEPKEGL